MPKAVSNAPPVSQRHQGADVKSMSRRDDILPADTRRTDESETAPDALPRPEDNLDAEGSPMTVDGGNPAHPVHDEDSEDSGPEDFEDDIDEAAAEGDVVDAMRRGRSHRAPLAGDRAT